MIADDIAALQAFLLARTPLGDPRFGDLSAALERVKAAATPPADADVQEFYGEHDAITQLRATSAGRELIQHIETRTAALASGAWVLAKPALSGLGNAAISALAQFAAASLQAQIAKLGQG